MRPAVKGTAMRQLNSGLRVPPARAEMAQMRSVATTRMAATTAFRRPGGSGPTENGAANNRAVSRTRRHQLRRAEWAKQASGEQSDAEERANEKQAAPLETEHVRLLHRGVLCHAALTSHLPEM